MLKDEEYIVKFTIIKKLEETRLMLDNVISFNNILEEKQVSHSTIKQHIDNMNKIEYNK